MIHSVAMMLAAWVIAVNCQAAEAADSGVKALALKVEGNKILNNNGEEVRLRGVNAACLEWTSDGQGHIRETVRVAIEDWNVNIIRLPLSQDRWFGKAPEQEDDGVSYRALITKIVDLCGSRGCYIILDLHWSNAGLELGTNIGQHSMPDKHSRTFWKNFAAVYANHPSVIFDLYNEPHDVSWDVWLNGGTVTDRPNLAGMEPVNYEAVGMQELLDTVRSTGAKNVILAGGLDWAYDMSGFHEGRQLKDPDGNGVIYANHTYDNKRQTVFTWIETMKKAAAAYPVIVAEFGGSGGPNRRQGWWGATPSTAMGDDWLLHVLQAIQDNNWSFTAWDLHPSAGPTLISGWDYAPTEDFGVYVQTLLVNGTLPEYAPPDPAEFAKEPATTLPESAREGGKNLYGDWHVEPEQQGGRNGGGSILAFSGDGTGKLAGQWITSRGLTELEDVRFEDNEVTFSQSARFGRDAFKANFAGTIEGNRLSGTFKHGGSESTIQAERGKETMAAGTESDSPIVGIWMLDLTGDRGSSTQRLKINPDMSGMFGMDKIDKIALEGDNMSFTMVRQFRQRTIETTFEGKLQGTTITGEVRAFRGTEKVAGTRVSGP